MRYALLVVFEYIPNNYGNYIISPCKGALSDITMMITLCLNKGIERKNITILTDLIELSNNSIGCNIKRCQFPNVLFFCRELCSFVENTIRGIESNISKNKNENPEIFIYFSCHGSEIPVCLPNNRLEQGIILFDSLGEHLRFLTTKDIFNILFGRIYISHSGLLKIPIYKKVKELVKIKDNNSNREQIKETNEKFSSKYKEVITSEVEFCEVYIQSCVDTPEESRGSPFSNPRRTTYNTNRGIPYFSNLLIITDTCYSGYMTHFPYFYDSENDKMENTSFINHYVKHRDIPYSVCISACSSLETTKSKITGSELTKIFYNQFKHSTCELSFNHLYYYLTNIKSKTVLEYLSKRSIFPVITSTQSDSNRKIPFFGSEIPIKPRKVIK